MCQFPGLDGGACLVQSFQNMQQVSLQNAAKLPDCILTRKTSPNSAATSVTFNHYDIPFQPVANVVCIVGVCMCVWVYKMEMYIFML